VWVEIPNVFNKPLRLSVAEAFALRAVADTALALPGAANSAALGSAIQKLNELTAIDDALVIENPHDPLLAELAHFCDISARVSLDYFSPTTNKSTSRSVVPRRIWLNGEHWYLDAIDLGINEPRVFRVDRMSALKDSGEVVDAATLPALADEPGFHWDAHAERVTLHLQPSAHWVAERYPVYSQRKIGDAVLEVVLPVTSAPWLGRLLVRAGNAAVVVSPEKYATLGADTAANILARYN
jgi:proteasome accessory factor C